MSELLSSIEIEVIESGEDDWVLFLHVMGIINEAMGMIYTEKEAQDHAQRLVLSFCDRGYARLGRYYNGRGFVPWTETGQELQNRLQDELTNPPPGESRDLNRMNIMLDILPPGQQAKDSQISKP